MMWYETGGHDRDVVLSTRVRLARNLKDYPFEPKLDAPSAKEIIDRVRGAFDGYTFVDFEKLDGNGRLSYAEKHLVSPEFARKSGPHALLSDEKQGVYVMVNEEDHVRIQSLVGGYQPDVAFRAALDAESRLDAAVPIAYSESLGYLTHCPTNLGTAMRVSVMMYLPAITMNREMAGLSAQLEKIGLTVRGREGEGSGALGYLYQISNQISLGITEEETLERVKSAVEKIMARERKLRENLVAEAGDRLRDRVGRAYGAMRYGWMMSGADLTDLYADARLGAALGYLGDVKAETLDAILIETMPATLSLREPKAAADAALRDKARAAYVREHLN